jgi:hypothetical protein
MAVATFRKPKKTHIFGGFFPLFLVFTEIMGLFTENNQPVTKEIIIKRTLIRSFKLLKIIA